MLTVLVVLIGVAIALLGLLAIVRDQFWPVALIALILLSFGVITPKDPGRLSGVVRQPARGAKGQRARRAGGVRARPLRQNEGHASLPRPWCTRPRRACSG
jgi:hypothetical protein